MESNRYFVIKVMVMTALLVGSFIVIEAEEFAGGSGTRGDPWQIATAEHLNNVRNYLGIEQRSNYFIQTADIDLGVAPWNEGVGWLPVGASDEEDRFFGNFDGGHHIIDNLTINRNASYQGLFGYIDGGTIKNIALTNVNVSSIWGPVGGLAGNIALANVSQCFVTGSIQGTQYVGGLAGHALEGNFSNCYTQGSVKATVLDSYAGGLFGYASGYPRISNSFSRMDVTGNKYYIGGLVGRGYGGSINQSYAAGKIVATDPDSEYVGGLIGRYGLGEVNRSYWDTQTTGWYVSANGGEERTTAEMTYPYDNNTFEGWDFGNIWAEDTGHSINDGYPFLRNVAVSVKENVLSELVPTNIRNYPNPFNPETHIRFKNTEDTDATLDIYNIKGELVRNLHNGLLKAGEVSFVWNGKDDSGRGVSSGVYFYRLQAANYELMNKMLLVK